MSPRILRAVAVSWVVALGAAVAAEKTAPVFVPATPSPWVGDWQGEGGRVAQVFVPEPGRWQVNVLADFDTPSAQPIAILRGAGAGDQLELTGETWSAQLRGTTLALRHAGATLHLRRVERPSPTLGVRAPDGATVLFDGLSLAAWNTKSGKDWLKPAGPAAWKLVDAGAGRALEIVPGADSLISRDVFGDCRVHLEFRTLGGPTNSGVYLQARYEVNINESYGRFDGNPNGGLDNCSDVKPAIRASRPALEWQTLDLDFTAPRFAADGRKTAPATLTVILNGVTLYTRQELLPPKGAAGRLGEAPTGPLLLQEHGQPVQFRNIWVNPR